MHKLLIRHMEAEDLPQIHALYSEHQAYADTLQLPFQPVAGWEGKLAARPGFCSLVALRGEELVGQLGLEVSSSPRRRHVASLGMGVKAGARRGGVGSALLRAAIDMAENWMQVTRMEIEVYADNLAAIALYAKHGFEVEGVGRNYAFRDGRYVDVQLMARLRGSVAQ